MKQESRSKRKRIKLLNSKDYSKWQRKRENKCNLLKLKPLQRKLRKSD
jgi:hypothetical protein